LALKLFIRRFGQEFLFGGAPSHQNVPILMTQLVKRAPPLIPQQVRGII
jgi:hypothetical protein